MAIAGKKQKKEKVTTGTNNELAKCLKTIKNNIGDLVFKTDKFTEVIATVSVVSSSEQANLLKKVANILDQLEDLNHIIHVGESLIDSMINSCVADPELKKLIS